jgi:hypothetical protein
MCMQRGCTGTLSLVGAPWHDSSLGCQQTCTAFAAHWLVPGPQVLVLSPVVTTECHNGCGVRMGDGDS